MLKNSMQLNRGNKLLPVTTRETVFLLAKSIGVMLVLNYLFYRSLWAVIPLAVIGYFYYQLETKHLLAQKREVAREQFKEMLLLTATGQKAGYSVENAFLSGYKDMVSLYGKNSSICRMLCILQYGKENNVEFSSIWKQIGEEIEIEEIQEFAQIYEISHKSSGNMAAIMEKTANIIIQKIEVEKEIRVLLSAKRLEQKIMNSMPFLIMLYISFTSPGYFDHMYHNFFGVLIMSICLFIYLMAYMLSIKIISIDV